MAIRYHLRLMAVVVKNIRILLIGCAVSLCGFSFADVEEEDSGALRIETETEAYSADIYLGNTAEGKPSKRLLRKRRSFFPCCMKKSCRIVTGKRGRNLAPLVPRELEM